MKKFFLAISNLYIVRKNGQDYVIATQTGEKFPLASGVICWILSAVCFLLVMGAFVVLIAESESLEFVELVDVKITALLVMVIAAIGGTKFSDVFLKRNNWWDGEDEDEE